MKQSFMKMSPMDPHGGLNNYYKCIEIIWNKQQISTLQMYLFINALTFFISILLEDKNIVIEVTLANNTNEM